jgi:hypothetical protein
VVTGPFGLAVVVVVLTVGVCGVLGVSAWHPLRQQTSRQKDSHRATRNFGLPTAHPPFLTLYIYYSTRKENNQQKIILQEKYGKLDNNCQEIAV